MQLNRAFGNPAGADMFSVQGTEEQFEGVVSGPERTLDDLLKHVKKFENMDERSATGRLWKTMRWAASPMEEAEQLSAELARHKGSLGIFLQLAQSAILARVDDRGVDQGGVLRIIQSQIARIQSEGTGPTDPRLSLWLDTVAEYASSKAFDDTITIFNGTPRASNVPRVEDKDAAQQELTPREVFQQRVRLIHLMEAQLSQVRLEVEQLRHNLDKDIVAWDLFSKQRKRLTLRQPLEFGFTEVLNTGVRTGKENRPREGSRAYRETFWWRYDINCSYSKRPTWRRRSNKFGGRTTLINPFYTNARRQEYGC